MALDMNGEYILPIPRAAVWSALNDPKILQQCIPGCESLDQVSETEFAVVARLPARFKVSCACRTSIRQWWHICSSAKARAALPASPTAMPRWCSPKLTAAPSYLSCLGPDWRQTRATRAAAHCRHAEKDRGPLFRQFRRGTCHRNRNDCAGPPDPCHLRGAFT